MLGEDRIELVGATQCDGFGRFTGFGLVGVRRGRENRFEQQGRVNAAIQRQVAHRQRAQGFAVVTISERDETRAFRVAAVGEAVEAHLQCDLDRRRAVVGVEHARQVRAAGLPGRDAQQGFGQFQARLVREAGEDHVFQLVRLLRDGGGDARLAMAEQVRPPARDCVEIALSVHALQPDPAPPPYRQQGQGVGVFGHLRARVPEDREIARPPGLGLC